MTDVKYSQRQQPFTLNMDFYLSEDKRQNRTSREESAGPLVFRDNRDRKRRLDGRFEGLSPAAQEN